MAWTNVAKPSSTTWTGTYPQGKQIYDDPSVAYDDSSTYYDSFNPSQWTNVLHATGTELVTNGSFSGSATGWTLGTGWAYGSNNVIWSILGSELVTNGLFSGGTTGWNLGSGWAYGNNNVGRAGGFAASISSLSQTISITAALVYRMTFTLSSVTAGFLRIGIGTTTNSNGNFLTLVSPTADGSYTYDVTAGSANSLVIIATPGSASSFAGNVDDVSVKFINGGTLSQNVGTTVGQLYTIAISTSGSTGFVTAALGASSYIIPAGQNGITALTANSSTLVLTPSSTFDGGVSSVSVKFGQNIWTTIAKPV